MTMEREALITALVAGYMTSRDVHIPLLDEDMTPDRDGEFVKYWESWSWASSLKYMDAVYGGSFGVKTWVGDTPKWVLDDIERHKKFCDEVDALPRYKTVTTFEQRIIRFATKKADEILAQQELPNP